MNNDTHARNIALLIDGDNASWHAIDPVLTVLAELGSVNVRRVYGNWSKPGLKGWEDMTSKHGIEPQQQFDLTKGKNATDMKMTIDAMDLLARGRIDGFGIMSSDSDFMPLATRIRQDGLPVYGFGGTKTPEAFKRVCTRFIDVDALLKEKRAPAKPTVEVPIDEALPAPIGTTSPARAAATSKDATAVDDEVVKLLIDAYDSVKRDERGYVSVSEMGQLAGNRSSFDARNYGYRRLGDLIQAVPNFQTERRDDGRLFVKRVR
ncbi:NYN domain-containing protein [Sphingomonas oligophenolica]|uniref:NYN domain-containing protein n=1 Tax=Sphingomonas oligophenolica TaxID=301154 RepID=A0A502CS70_9SPHN|nr:NYN domain-containing protein [Sphingomonas oligophenolica]TPG14561.1 NYN domain-containing protein [Sphingomonas oligophenolica]